jgi:3-hydroxymyristoyl/3-hydroxydecanoyl-(acyl carrier protein) dehydratase
MAPAPALPPVLSRRAPAPRPLAAAAMAPAPSSAAAPASARSAAVLAHKLGMLDALADAHVAHVQSMLELHRRFLAAQSEAQSRLLALRSGARASVVPLPPSTVAAPRPPAAAAAAQPLVRQPLQSLPGPKIDRRALEELAAGTRTISSLFGPAFARQDTHRYQIRIPAAPLNITDRILGIEGEPGSLGRGRLWAEADVRADSWGLDPTGHVSSILLGESGQTNMLLASWLGADLTHDGDRRYRLLDLDLTVVGAFPKAGDTIEQQITLKRQALVGDMRLFFFENEMRVRGELRARARFSAGLFGEAVLERPEYVKWDAATDKRELDGTFELPADHGSARAFSRAAIAAFGAGRIADCFGAGFERARTHVRTPRLAMHDMFLLDEVAVFDPKGGPWGRGYLRATQTISPEDEMFAAHLPGDPCLPGFLLLEAGVQALSFYLTALGLTLARDGWRFEPLRQRRYTCAFRGQITPQSTVLVHEVFVESLVCGPEPHIVADITCSLDGRPVFHARRIALGLSPDWPLEQFRLGAYAENPLGAAGPLAALGGLAGYRGKAPPAAVIEGGIEGGYPAMLALCWGRAQDAFGKRLAVYDGPTRWPRLPAPPFLFVSRVTRIDAQPFNPRPGSWIESAYDIPEAAWYFRENGYPTMPFAVLLESALQPCGWLMFYVAPEEAALGRFLRNLDGTATFHEELPPKDATLNIRTELVAAASAGGATLDTLEVRGYLDERCAYQVRATFGVFQREALAQQAGLPATDAERARIAALSDFHVDLAAQPARYFSGSLRLAGPMLRMIQRVTAFDPAGGGARLGWLRAEKDVDPNEWFFKAHFFQDPVQPGSLGLEALLQLLQFFMIERGLAEGVTAARFEPVAIGRPMSWKYRGQALPESRQIVTEIELAEIGRDQRGVYAVAQGWLWVDGVRVYHATDLAMRIVSGARARS